MATARVNDTRWKEGRTFSLVYYAGEEVEQLLKEAYTLYFAENGLNPSAFPSLRRFESEVVSMAASLLNGDEEATGNMTAGGTESILMAVKAAKEHALKQRPGLKEPEMIVPVSAHPAFDKAAHYFGLKLHHAPLREDYRVDVDAVAQLVNENTVLIVGSAPAYPHGVIDPLAALSELAVARNIWLHVDACVGGFILPFIHRLGRSLPAWNFELPGVNSISLDLHKYGYSAKGASLILYRNASLRRNQFFVYTEWPGGIYGSPSVTGTRPGGAIAAAWAILNYLGEEGYLDITRRTLQVTDRFREGITEIPGLRIISNPELSLLAFTSDTEDIYEIGDEMTLKGWHMDRQQYPPSLHLTINLVHEQSVEAFLVDLRQSVEKVSRLTPGKVGRQLVQTLVKGATQVLPEKWVSELTSFASKMGGDDIMPKRTAAMYGMMGNLPNRGDVRSLIMDFMDKLVERK
jgi:glutamate/tyrosine decarboxylase-like PLP-dependent enzyme